MKRIYPVLAVLLILGMASCTLFNTPPEQTEPSELSAFRAKYLTSFDILNGTFSQSGRALMPFNLPVVDESQARATVPTTASPIPDFSFLSLPATASISNYPEVGQTSTWTVDETLVPDVYLVKVTITFPDTDPRKEQEEWYYIKDQRAATGYDKDQKAVTGYTKDNKAETTYLKDYP